MRIGGPLSWLFLGSFVLTAAVQAGQERAQDRRRWIDFDRTQVTNDPRRVPMPRTVQGPPGATVLTGGRLFDGTRAEAREATLVLERNLIHSVLPAGSTDWPAGARVVDVSGKTVLPGLIDLHVHLTEGTGASPGSPGYDPADEEIGAEDPSDHVLFAVERLRIYIESGVTSIRDVGSHGRIVFRLKEWVGKNRVLGPRIFPAGQLITSTGGHGAEKNYRPDPSWDSDRIAEGPEAWRAAVREQFNKGADVIKLASHFSREEIQAAVSEAHALGLRVTVDAETFYIQWAVEAGADSIEHPLPRTDETIRLMAERGTASVPTLIAYMYIFDRSGGYHASTSRRFTFSREENLEMLRKLKAAGVKLGIGTDLWTGLHEHQPGPYITELKQFVAAGFTKAEALVAATKSSAEILDMDDRLGTLEKGKLADVLVVDGSPDLDLDDLAKIDLVFKDGYLLVEGGRLSVPRHAPRTPLKESP